jgi:hypothetical protein
VLVELGSLRASIAAASGIGDAVERIDEVGWRLADEDG